MSKTKTRKASGAGARPAKDDTPKVMGFGIFRKHQKTVLWAAVIFTVFAFGLFASLSDIDAFLQGDGQSGLMATFTVPATGETVEVTEADYFNQRRSLANMRGGNLTEDDIYVHMMLVADAEAVGLKVSDDDLRRALSARWGNVSTAQYKSDVRSLGFGSTREFETAVREQLLTQRYMDLLARNGAVVDADTVFARWRVDNERFSYQALVFADEPLESIADPSEDELRAFWDDMPEKQRSRTYRDPARQDIVVATLTFDHDLAELPAEHTADLPEPADPELRSRFNLSRATRFPDAEDMTDEIAAVLAREVKLIRYVQKGFRAFNEREAEDKTKAAFLEVAETFGLPVVDPEGLLGPEEQAALPEVGTPNLERLSRVSTTGQVRLDTPFDDGERVQLVFYEAHEDSVELDFEGARDQLVEDWKESRQDRRATEFRESLTAAARALPEAAADITPLEELAEEEAVARIEALREAGEEEIDEAAIRAEELARMDPAIEAILAEHEAAAFDELAPASGGELLTFTDVPRSYVMAPDEDEAADSLERFLKTSPQVFAQAVDTVTPTLRHFAGESSVVVRITARELPDKAAMFADPAGMARSRLQASNEARSTALLDIFDPEALKASHDLRLVEPEDPAAAADS